MNLNWLKNLWPVDMKILMLSLDKNILNKDSIVARRMIEYGKENELFIIIPNREKESFDLSSTVHVRATGGNKLWQFCRLKKIGQKLIKENNIEEITTQDPFFIGLVGWRLKRKFKIKLEAQVHGDFFGGYYKNQWFKLCLAKFILKQADTVRVVGERVKQSLLNLGIAQNKIIVKSIQNDPELIKNFSSTINLRKQYSGYEKIFLVLGRLEPVKNIAWLIDLFNEVVKQKQNYLLLIAGSGAEKNKLINQVKEKKLEKNIKFKEWINDPYSYLKTADCVLFPSLSEGCGLVSMEAFMVGTPVIMTDVGVANYELKPDSKVKIVPVGDRNKFIEAILKI